MQQSLTEQKTIIDDRQDKDSKSIVAKKFSQWQNDISRKIRRRLRAGYDFFTSVN